MNADIPDLGAAFSEAAQGASDAVHAAIEPDHHDVKREWSLKGLDEPVEPEKAYHDPLWDVMDPPEHVSSLNLD